MNAKPFLIILMFILFLAIFASGAIGQTDLTPDTPPMASDRGTGFDPNGAAPALLAGGTGGLCASPYIVKPGDTLSQIARTCGLSLENLLAANAGIHNPDLIHAGQAIQIFYPPQMGATPLPLIPTAAPQPAAPPEGLLPEAAADEARAATASLTQAGGTVDVEVRGLPPDTPVKIGIGRVNAVPAMVDTATTDAQGRYKGKVVIPAHARAPEVWTVTVLTGGKPQIKVTSVPFEIQK